MNTGNRYMLDFKGIGAKVSNETMQEAVETLDFKASMEKLGSLPVQVTTWCVEQGLMMSDRGFGDDRWHIGIPFDDPLLALSAMLKAEQKFTQAIARNWLSLHLITWGPQKPETPPGECTRHGVMP